MTSEAAIQKGKGILANPEFFLAFFLAATMGAAGLLTVGISGVWGWSLVALSGILAAVAHFTGLGQRFFVILMSLFGLLSGILAVVCVTLLWAAPAEGWMIMGETLQGHGNALMALVFFVVGVAVPPAVIYGEKILPLFIAFLAAIWGVMSVIIFVMVVFIGVD